MNTFISTTETSVTANKKVLETSHWQIEARDLETATAIATGRADNATRTIPSVTHKVIEVRPFDRRACIYLARGMNCQGHPILTPLKQQRGGNEG